jgi:hypothetical protein
MGVPSCRLLGAQAEAYATEPAARLACGEFGGLAVGYWDDEAEGGVRAGEAADFVVG